MDRKAYAFASTGNTIAPIVGKLAKFEWQIPMTDEPVRVTFRLDRDPLLVSVMRSAVRFQALQAGLDEQACGEFAGAYEDVCQKTLTQVTDPERGLEVTLETFPDRIEIGIHCDGQTMPAIGLETFACADVLGRGKDGLNGLELLSRVDRVLYNTEQGAARTTLVKYLQPKR
jgi:hypothetical protein